jgi:hypothetical protein
MLLADIQSMTKIVSQPQPLKKDMDAFLTKILGPKAPGSSN